jgi:hypothetical protein
VRFLAFAFLLIASAAYSDDREMQRALIQRDQQSAEFAARGIEARRAMETLHSSQLRDAGQPLSPDPVIARQLRPYERERMAHERELVKPAQVKKSAAPDYSPLPLPGSSGPPVLVQPISTPSIGG